MEGIPLLANKNGATEGNPWDAHKSNFENTFPKKFDREIEAVERSQSGREESNLDITVIPGNLGTVWFDKGTYADTHNNGYARWSGHPPCYGIYADTSKNTEREFGVVYCSHIIDENNHKIILQ